MGGRCSINQVNNNHETFTAIAQGVTFEDWSKSVQTISEIC